MTSAPALRELPLIEIPEAKCFAEAVCGGAVDALVLLTGVGTSLLLKAALTHRTRADLVLGLSKVTLVCRGPKPSTALKPYGLRASVNVPEPNTWREIIDRLDRDWPVSGRHVWIQEYGTRNEPFIQALTSRGAQVRSVRVYSWSLPEDTAPLKAAILKIIRGQAHVAMFTTARQIDHLLSVAAELGLATAVRRALSEEVVVASVGPMTSEALQRHGIRADIVPGHPKLGHLVLAVARRSRVLVRDKRERHQSGDGFRVGK